MSALEFNKLQIEIAKCYLGSPNITSAQFVIFINVYGSVLRKVYRNCMY